MKSITRITVVDKFIVTAYEGPFKNQELFDICKSHGLDWQTIKGMWDELLPSVLEVQIDVQKHQDYVTGIGWSEIPARSVKARDRINVSGVEMIVSEVRHQPDNFVQIDLWCVQEEDVLTRMFLTVVRTAQLTVKRKEEKDV